MIAASSTINQIYTIHTPCKPKKTVEFPALNSSSNPDVSGAFESIPSSDGSPTSIGTAGAAGLLLLRFFRWRLCHRGRRERPCGRLRLLALIQARANQQMFNAAGGPCLGSLAVHLKLHEFRLGDGFPHFFGPHQTGKSGRITDVPHL